VSPAQASSLNLSSKIRAVGIILSYLLPRVVRTG
jgi:hypothetical protein